MTYSGGRDYNRRDWGEQWRSETLSLSVRPTLDFDRVVDGCTDKKTLEKRRNRTSSSGESSTLPEPKKQRSDNVSVNEADETNKTDNEIFAALNMAEGFHKTLLEINSKLEKLDIIQEAVTEVQTSLHKLEVRMQNLESSQETAN